VIASLVSSLGDPGCRVFDAARWIHRRRIQGR
jgi:hypothetical protein